ncbi:MAG: hypothetical protein LBF89_01915 [Bacteroidales bacterium]|nr:hypothetical protein [Bacteroidales bacterium]
MEYARTSHNRTVSALPPVGGEGIAAGSVIALCSIPTPHSTHSFAALLFAAQSPYSGRQNIGKRRNVIRNAAKNFWKEITKYNGYQ